MSSATDTSPPEVKWVPTHIKLKSGETAYTGDQGEWALCAPTADSSPPELEMEEAHPTKGRKRRKKSQPMETVESSPGKSCGPALTLDREEKTGKTYYSETTPQQANCHELELPPIRSIADLMAENIDPPGEPEPRDEEDDMEAVRVWRDRVVENWNWNRAANDPLVTEICDGLVKWPVWRERLIDFCTNAKNWARVEVDADKASEIVTVDDMLNFDRDADESALIGEHRWLCRGSQAVVQGPTGVGKSSLTMQWALSLCLGRALFGEPGLMPVRPMRVLIIQAENDLGDMAEAFQDITEAANISDEDLDQIRQRLSVVRNCTSTGQDFCDVLLYDSITEHKPDIVFVDPLLAYVGGDVVQQAYMSKFLRTMVAPIVEETRALLIWVHHTSKSAGNANGQEKSDEQKKYAGLGSVEVQNVAREVINLSDQGNGKFQLSFQKRGRRLNMRDGDGNVVDFINIEQGRNGIVWSKSKGEATHADKKGMKVIGSRDKIRDYIIKEKTVTASQLKTWAAMHSIGVNMAATLANALADDKNLEVRIYRCKLKKEGVYSTNAPHINAED